MEGRNPKSEKCTLANLVEKKSPLTPTNKDESHHGRRFRASGFGLLSGLRASDFGLPATLSTVV